VRDNMVAALHQSSLVQAAPNPLIPIMPLAAMFLNPFNNLPCSSDPVHNPAGTRNPGMQNDPSPISEHFAGYTATKTNHE
jgi:hypothetical protein